MSYKISLMYRGDAVVYALIEFDEMPTGCKPAVRVLLGNHSLPCGIYDAPQVLTSNTMLTGAIRRKEDRKNAHDGHIFVLAYPLVKATVKIDIVFKDKNGHTIATEKSVKITEKKTKWLSRYSYRYHGMEGGAIRDIEKKCEVDQITTQPLRILQTEDVKQIIVKGLVEIPVITHKNTTETLNVYESNNSSMFKNLNEIKELASPCVLILDKQGNKCENVTVYLGEPKIISTRGRERMRVFFNVFLPLYSNYSCIIFYSHLPKVRPAFFSIETKYLHRRKEELNLDDQLYRAQRIDRYQAWRLTQFMRGRPAFAPMPTGPTFSIVVPLYKTPKKFFHEMYESVLHQSYEKWELVLVNASPDDAQLRSQLNKIDDARVKIITLDENLGIADNTNAGIKAATGDYICLLDHDDILDLDVLSEYAQAITRDPEIDVLYCDEDFYAENDGCQTPQFKSDFNIDLLRSGNYIAHLLCVRDTLIKNNLERAEYDGAQDYDLVLRLSEKTNRFHHIPRVLYHWRVHDKSTSQSTDNKKYAMDSGVRALQSHMERVGIKGQATNAMRPCLYRMKFSFDEYPLVSIIIPNKDAAHYLKKCIDSIEEKTTWKNFEIIVVENNSETIDVFNLYEELETCYENVRVVAWEGDFNYSEINNFGATFANGEYLILLNNDTEVITPKWIEEMLGFCKRADVGAVGVKLFYPDNTIQHAGICIMQPRFLSGISSPANVYQFHERTYQGSSGRWQLAQNMMAVTGACMMTSATDYARVGGMSKEFAVDYNDVDYCLKLREAGLLITYTPYAELYHHESISRSISSEYTDHKSRARCEHERGLLLSRWSDVMCEPDPYFGAASQVII